MHRKKIFNIQMNKKILLLTFSILAIILLVFYFVFKPESPKNVQTQLFIVNDRQYLVEDTTRGSLAIDIEVEFPVSFQEKNILEKINHNILSTLLGDHLSGLAIDSSLKVFTRELKKEYLNNNAIIADKLEETDFLVLNNSFSLEGFALLNDNLIFSYGIVREVDFGGTHPTRTRLFYNYNLSTGELITERDIFKDGYKEQLTTLLQVEIQRMSRENNDMPVLEDFEKTEYNVSAIHPNGNFYINDQAICYVFNPFEIAPFSYTYETEVVLPYSLLKDLIKADCPIQYLVQQHETALQANNN